MKVITLDVQKKDLQVMRSSAGLGLFAKAPIKKGALIIEYVGRDLTPTESENHPGRYLFEISSKRTIDGVSRSNTARYINHSCKPNCEAEIKQGRVFIRAIKNIAAGSELTYDYGEDYFNEFLKPHGCRCEKCQPTPGK